MDQPPFFRTILVGDNGTPEAARAVAVAMSLGEKYKAKVILLGVLVPPSAEALAEGYGLTDPAVERKKAGRTPAGHRSSGPTRRR